MITQEEVRAAQRKWARAIEDISDVYINDGDYDAAARKYIHDLYAYDIGEDVLFKPPLAAQDQFRETYERAVSYFVGGVVEEDKGFAIKPWSTVRFGKQQIILPGDYAVAMGNYYFTPVGRGEDTKVEFTFGYLKDENGGLRINLHHSSLPYQP